MLQELEALGGVEAPTYRHFWDWVRKSFTPSYQKEIEQVLRQSVDVYDLEQKMKTLRRRGML